MPPQQNPAYRTVRNVLLALSGLWCLSWFIHAWPYWEDDAYIHLEFARSFAAHQGFAFNGRIVSGDTAPLWVVLLAAAHAVIPNWLVAGKVLTIFGAAFGLTGAYQFARRLIAPFPSLELLPAALVLLIVVNPYFCYWAFSGMEPLTAVGVAFFATLAATRQLPTAKSFLTGCLLAGLAPLLRPEMIFLTAIVSLLLLAQWIRLPRGAGKAAAFLAGLVLLIAPLATWSLYSFHAFGRFIPNTNAAKRAAPGDSVPHHLLNIYSLGLPIVLCGVLAGIVYLVLRPASVRASLQNAIVSILHPVQPTETLPLAGWVFLLWPAINTIFYIVNHTYVQTRYILITAPGLTIVIIVLAFAAAPRTGRAVYAAALVAALAVSLVSVRPFIRNKGLDCDATRELAFFLRDHTPPGAPVAVYSIGEIAFYANRPIIDTGGITRPGAIPYLNAPPEAMLQWARSEGAQYYITDRQPEPGATLVYTVEGRFLGWSFHPALYDTTFPVNLWKLADPQPTAPASLRHNLTAVLTSH